MLLFPQASKAVAVVITQRFSTSGTWRSAEWNEKYRT